MPDLIGEIAAAVIERVEERIAELVPSFHQATVKNVRFAGAEHEVALLLEGETDANEWVWARSWMSAEDVTAGGELAANERVVAIFQPGHGWRVDRRLP